MSYNEDDFVRDHGYYDITEFEAQREEMFNEDIRRSVDDYVDGGGNINNSNAWYSFLSRLGGKKKAPQVQVGGYCSNPNLCARNNGRHGNVPNTISGFNKDMPDAIVRTQRPDGTYLVELEKLFENAKGLYFPFVDAQYEYVLTNELFATLINADARFRDERQTCTLIKQAASYCYALELLLGYETSFNVYNPGHFLDTVLVDGNFDLYYNIVHDEVITRVQMGANGQIEAMGGILEYNAYDFYERCSPRVRQFVYAFNALSLISMSQYLQLEYREEIRTGAANINNIPAKARYIVNNVLIPTPYDVNELRDTVWNMYTNQLLPEFMRR